MVEDQPACLISLPNGTKAIAWEIASVAVSTLLLCAYLYDWRRQVQSRPLHTMRGTMMAVRRSWVAHHMGKGMLPVNTLRDIIGSCQWFASSALLVAVGCAGYVASGNVNGILHVKMVCLLAACCTTFTFFMHATRYYTHVSLLINTPDIGGAPITEEVVFKVVQRASFMWSYGVKASICVLPLLAWIFGPLYLVFAMLLALHFMRQLDFEAFEPMLAHTRASSASTQSEAATHERAPLAAGDSAHDAVAELSSVGTDAPQLLQLEAPV